MTDENISVLQSRDSNKLNILFYYDSLHKGKQIPNLAFLSQNFLKTPYCRYCRYCIFFTTL